MNNSLNLALQQVSRKLSVDLKLVELVYKSYWLFFRKHVAEYDIKEVSQDELNTLTTNINIPYIGKLYVDNKKIAYYKKQLNYYQNDKAEENKADRLSSVSD